MALEFRELGRRIASARQDIGFTQQECASKAGMSRTALAKIETGRRGISALELARLADALEMRIEWFFEDAPPSVVSRRMAAGAGVSSTQVDRMVERFAREVTFLEKIGTDLALPATPELPVPASFEAAESAAMEVRGLLGYAEAEPAINLSARAATIGLLAFSLKFGAEGADGASILLDPGGVAVVNGSRDIGRRRLTLAHELGHYVFADAYSTDWRVANASASRTEALIDRFARALLLPSHILDGHWRGGDDTRTDAVVIASRFRVDMSTLAQRLAEMAYASPDEIGVVRATKTDQADMLEHSLYVPTELEPPELPGVYKDAVLSAYRKEKISAARALGLLLDTLEEDRLPELPPVPAEASWSFVS